MTPATPPKKLVAPTERTVYLDPSGTINAPLACRGSGKLRLSEKGGSRIGSAKFECDLSLYQAVASVDLGAAKERSLRRRVSPRKKLKLSADFKLGNKKLSARLKLAEADARRARAGQSRSGQYWATGWLSCGRPASQQLSQPGFQMYHPGVSARGYRADAGFYNDTSYTDRVWYRPYLYFYEHGWWAGGWRGPIVVPPGTTIALTGSGDQLGDPPQNYYIAGVSYVWWENGYKDWNWLPADSPYFGYPTDPGGYWCDT